MANRALLADLGGPARPEKLELHITQSTSLTGHSKQHWGCTLITEQLWSIPWTEIQTQMGISCWSWQALPTFGAQSELHSWRGGWKQQETRALIIALSWEKTGALGAQQQGLGTVSNRDMCFLSRKRGYCGSPDRKKLLSVYIIQQNLIKFVLFWKVKKAICYLSQSKPCGQC